MIKRINVSLKNEITALVSNVTYSVVSDWFDHTCIDLKMSLIVPKHRENHEKLPCILFICGGSYKVVNKDVWLSELEYFAKRGFVVATCEYRTSNKASFPAPLIDVKSAIRYLKAHSDLYSIDKDKIIIAGESAGGTLATLASVYHGKYDEGDWLNENSEVAAVIDYYGITDIEQGMKFENTGCATYEYLSFVGEKENIPLASSLLLADKSTPPTLILHGSNDDVVEVNTQSVAYYEKLQSLGVSSDLYIFNGAGHGEDVFYQDSIKDIVIEFINNNI